jgi:hypothetical protein
MNVYNNPAREAQLTDAIAKKRRRILESDTDSD